MKDCPKCGANVDGLVCPECGEGGTKPRSPAGISHDPICVGEEVGTGYRCNRPATIFQGSRHGHCRDHWLKLPQATEPAALPIIAKVKAMLANWQSRAAPPTVREAAKEYAKAHAKEREACAHLPPEPLRPKVASRFPHPIKGRWYPEGDPRNG